MESAFWRALLVHLSGGIAFYDVVYGWQFGGEGEGRCYKSNIPKAEP